VFSAAFIILAHSRRGLLISHCSWAFFCDCTYSAEYVASSLYEALPGLGIRTQQDFFRHYLKACESVGHSSIRPCRHVLAGPELLRFVRSLNRPPPEPLLPELRAVFNWPGDPAASPRAFSVALESQQGEERSPWRCFVFRNRLGYLCCDRCSSSGKDCEHARRVLKYRRDLVNSGYLREHGQRSAAAPATAAAAAADTDDEDDMPDTEDFQPSALPPPLHGGKDVPFAPLKCLARDERIPPLDEGVLPVRYPVDASVFCQHYGNVFDSQCSHSCRCLESKDRKEHLCSCGRALIVGSHEVTQS